MSDSSVTFSDESTTIHLKVVASLNVPPLVEGYHVPILDPNSHSSMAVSKWDLATQQVRSQAYNIIFLLLITYVSTELFNKIGTERIK